MTTIDKKQAQVKIIEAQREFMNPVLDYQMAYGANSLEWGAQVKFVEK